MTAEIIDLAEKRAERTRRTAMLLAVAGVVALTAAAWWWWRGQPKAQQ